MPDETVQPLMNFPLPQQRDTGSFLGEGLASGIIDAIKSAHKAKMDNDKFKRKILEKVFLGGGAAGFGAGVQGGFFNKVTPEKIIPGKTVFEQQQELARKQPGTTILPTGLKNIPSQVQPQTAELGGVKFTPETFTTPQGEIQKVKLENIQSQIAHRQLYDKLYPSLITLRNESQQEKERHNRVVEAGISGKTVVPWIKTALVENDKILKDNPNDEHALTNRASLLASLYNLSGFESQEVPEIGFFSKLWGGKGKPSVVIKESAPKTEVAPKLETKADVMKEGLKRGWDEDYIKTTKEYDAAK